MANLNSTTRVSEQEHDGIPFLKYNSYADICIALYIMWHAYSLYIAIWLISKSILRC